MTVKVGPAAGVRADETAGVTAAFIQRVRTAATALGAAPVPAGGEDEAGALLESLVAAVRGPVVDRSAVWLVLTALVGTLPTSTEVVEAARMLELSTPIDGALGLLDRAHTVSLVRGNPRSEMDVVTGAVVVDVDRTVHSDRHTGIQRVVRETVPFWNAAHPITLAGWTDNLGALRRLTDRESQAVLTWRDDAISAPGAAAESIERSPARLLVPWHSVLALPEVPAPEYCRELAALAEFSPNAVVAIGYDAIPIVSADLRPRNEPDLFVLYLNVIKHSQRVAGISSAAAAEFQGFSASLLSQGIAGPLVAEIQLADQELSLSPAGDTAELAASASTEPESDRPLVLCVGSQEIHKNHLAVMHAAERLWRDGLDFSLEFVGRPGWDMTAFDEAVAALQLAGRRLVVTRGMGDDALARAYGAARFAIFPSLHEGYGLPVAEALAAGTPVITSNFGSMREIAEAGGCLLVDPRDDDDILEAMRTLLTDDSLRADLERQARARAGKGWNTYATELWDFLIAPELAS